MELSESLSYPEDRLFLTQHTIVDDETVRTYRFWDQAYTHDSARDLLNSAGFSAVDIYEDLAGTPSSDGSKTLAALASRA